MEKPKKTAGKKRKGGQPKQPPIQAFDIEFINKNDLKKYVILLEKELALMRKDCAFYSSNKEKIMEFLETRRNCLTAQNEMSVIRKSEKDEIVELMRRFPERYNEKLLLAERERVAKKLQNLFHDFVVRSSTEASHFDREQFLKMQITDKDKRLEFDQFHSTITMIDMKETYQNAQEDIDLKYSKKLEAILNQSIGRSLKANQDFNSNKTRMLVSLWNVQNRQHAGLTKESYINEMKRMEGFFHEISSNNNEVINVLRDRLATALTELKKVTFNLKQVTVQNMKLRVIQPAGYLPIRSGDVSVEGSPSIKNTQNENDLERLNFKNEILQEQLRMEKEKFQNLKKQLISATRKIYQKAESKAHLLEELIKMNLQLETMPKEKKDPKVQKREAVRSYQKIGKKDGVLNVFTVKVENSDTLFVPPLYNEFWDPSVKLSA